MRIALTVSSLGLVLALSAAPATAQHLNAKDAPCQGPSTTVDDVACFSKALNAGDQELTQLLAAIHPALRGEELTLLDRAQAAWTEYRKQSCEGEYAMYGGGSAGPTARLACLEALTRDRIKQLHAAYDWRVEKPRKRR